MHTLCSTETVTSDTASFFSGAFVKWRSLKKKKRLRVEKRKSVKLKPKLQNDIKAFFHHCKSVFLLFYCCINEGTMDEVLASLQRGQIRLRKAPSPSTASPKMDPRSNLMSAIRQGVTLKKVKCYKNREQAWTSVFTDCCMGIISTDEKTRNDNTEMPNWII